LVVTDVSNDLQGQAVLEVEDSSLLACDNMSLGGYLLMYRKTAVPSAWTA
jgi:hypothetical protein